jgi:hypothetical protein
MPTAQFHNYPLPVYLFFLLIRNFNNL